LNQYFTGGQFVGHGFGMKLDADRNIRVSFVYKDSPMDKQGVTRGYKLTQINGQTVSSLLANNTFSSAFGEDKAGVKNRFQVEDLSGKIREFTIAKEAVTMNTVLHRSVFQESEKKVGYLVFNTFVEKSVAELNEAFAYFKNQGVSELVLDLRYNGGGSLDVAQHLAGLIGASKASAKEFVELTYNAQKQEFNKPYNFKATTNDLNLSRLFVITTGSSASASEAVINGLKPYMDVITIGDATHGKPVGMNPMEIENSGLVLVPITFKVANADGQAEYFNGIPVNASVSDDLAAQFGDATEDCLEQALYYIKNGSFSPVIASGRRASASDRNNEIPLQGFRAEIGAF
jgi:C-terminal peptidase prc